MENTTSNKFFNVFIYISVFAFLFNKTCYLPETIDLIVSAISLGSFLSISLFYALRFKYSKIIIYFSLYFIFGLLSCYLGQYSTPVTFFKIYYPVFGLLLLIDIFIEKKDKLIIVSLEHAFFMLIFINFLSIIFFPNGLFSDGLYSNNWFLLYDNLHVFIYIPALVVSLISSRYKNSKVLFYIILFMIIFSVAYCKSATSMVGLSVLLILFILRRFLKRINFLNAVTYVYIYVGIFVGIVVLRMQELFSFFIVDYLHRDLTFTGRTLLWDKIINYIAQKPLLGYGIETNSIFVNKMGFRLYTHAHNTIYDILYKGGILSLIFFFLIIITASKNAKKSSNSYFSFIISGGLLSLYTMMNFEAREDKIGLYLLLILAFYINKLLQNNKNIKEESDLNE